MDNKITKKRLAEMLSYDWIKVILFCILFVILFEVILGAFSVKITPGQRFEIILYNNINSSGSDKTRNLLAKEEALSFDVLSFQITSLDTVYYSQTLRAREETAQCDILIIDNAETVITNNENSYADSNMKNIIDGYSIYDYQSLINDAKSYLSSFLKEGKTFDEAKNSLNFEEFFDKEKIASNFEKRMKSDNRFRTKEAKEQGISLEEKRIEKLFKETVSFEKLFNEFKDTELFTKYTKYERAYNMAVVNQSEADQIYNKPIYDKQVEEVGALYYGLNFDFLTKNEYLNKDKELISSYFKYLIDIDTPEEEVKKNNVEDMVLLTFNFKNQQPDLQFEVIPVINSFIRACSTLLD